MSSSHRTPETSVGSNVSLGPMPPRLLFIRRISGELVPAWFTDHDRPWLRDLLQEVLASTGQPVRELERRLRQSDVDPRAGRNLLVARHMVVRALRSQRPKPGLANVRRALFAAAASGGDRTTVLSEFAAKHGIDKEALLAGLFADLPHARTVVLPIPLFELSRLILALNLTIAKGILRFATGVDLHLVGASTAVLRTAWLHGTHFTIVDHGQSGVRMRWSRPTQAPSATRGLVAMLPVLPWARLFELRARCLIQGADGVFVLTTTDAILPGPEPRTFDSHLERRFAHDVRAASPDWDVLREPAPVVVDGALAFPDFQIRNRRTGESCLVEIAGLRDRAALPLKLKVLQAVPKLFLCIQRALVPAEWQHHPRLIAVDRKIDAAAVLCRLQATRLSAPLPQSIDASSS